MALTLDEQLSRAGSTLCVVPTFADAARVTERLARHAQGFAAVHSAPNRVRALFSQAARGHGVIMVDSDVGARTTLAMRVLRGLHPGLRFAVYEEGESLFAPMAQERPAEILVRLGATPTIGQGALTSEVWSYTPEALRARLPDKRLMRIERPPAEYVASQRDLLNAVFWPSHARDTHAWGGSRCVLYLSSWDVDRRVLARLRQSGAYTIFKPHPHLTDAGRTGLAEVDQVLPAEIPSELVLLTLAEAFEEVRVLHHGSTTQRYVTSSNVHFTNVSAARP